MKLANMCKKLYKNKNKGIVEALKNQKLGIKINPDNLYFKNLNEDGLYGSILNESMNDHKMIRDTENFISNQKEYSNYFEDKKKWEKNKKKK